MRNYLFIIGVIMSLNTYSQVVSEWRGIGRTGVYSDEKNLLKEWPKNGPELLWYVDSIPKTYASVAVAYGKVFTTGIVDTMDVLLAFNDKGEKLWETPYGRAWDSSYEHSRSTPTIEDNRIYLSSGLGDLACVSAEDGALIWSVKAAHNFEGAAGRFGYSESLLIQNDKVFFTSAGNKTTIIALNKLTGAVMWSSESLNDVAVYTSPMLIESGKKKQIINFTEKYLFSVNPDNGHINWKFNFGEYAGGRNKRNNHANTPLFYNNELFLTSGYDHKSVMLSLNQDWTDVSIKWVDSVLDVHFGGVVQYNGYIYGANWLHNRMGNWTCLNWETGKAEFSAEWGNKGSIIAADEMLYCYEEKSGTIGIAPMTNEKFEIVSSFKVPYGQGPHWAHLVINNGKLYVRSSTAIMVYNIKQN